MGRNSKKKTGKNPQKTAAPKQVHDNKGGKSKVDTLCVNGKISDTTHSEFVIQKSPTSKAKLPDGYVTSGDKDVTSYFDYNHVSLNSSNKKLLNQFRSQKSASRGSGQYNARGAKNALNSAIVSSVVEQKPVVTELEKGLDLKEMKKSWCCFGAQEWDARRFAHGMSTNFSRYDIKELKRKNDVITKKTKNVKYRVNPNYWKRWKEEDLMCTVDFVSDFANIKTLLKAHGSDSHMSYLLHRVGNSVTIDHLDLASMLHFPEFSSLPSTFVDFVIKITGENGTWIPGSTGFRTPVPRSKIRREGRSDKDVMAKEAFHKVLHSSMKRSMQVDLSSRKADNSAGSDHQFLHHARFCMDNLQILAGTDTPIFLKSDDAFPDTLTIRSMYDRKRLNDGATLDPLDAFDLWLDNTVLQCRKALLIYQQDWKITKTQWIETHELPNFGKFDLNSYMEQGEKLLKFLKEEVKTGNSYWLYRAPESCEMTLYNISNIFMKQEAGRLPVFSKWPLLQPYFSFFGSEALRKYSECFSEVVADKLCAETVYEPPDAELIMQGIINNNNNNINNNVTTGKDANLKTSVNGTSNATQKFQKLGNKLDNLANNVKKHYQSKDDSWMIQSVDEIHTQCFNRVVTCVEKIYSTAVMLTPSTKISIYRHALEKYFVVCQKLADAIGPSNERLKCWEFNERTRQFVTCYTEGICGILTLLLDWYGEVDEQALLDLTVRYEWKCLGSRVHALYADTMSVVIRKIHEKVRDRSIDSKLPTSENHDKIVSIYQKAWELLPKDVPSQLSSDQVAKREELIDEINKKTALAFLNTARFHLTFPSFLEHAIGGPTEKRKAQPRSTGKTIFSRDNGNEVDAASLITPNELTQDRIKAHNDMIFSLLEKCLECALKVKTSDKQLKSLKIQTNALMGHLKGRNFRLANISLADHFNFGEEQASLLEACLDVQLPTEEELAAGIVNGTGRGIDCDHFKTTLCAFREKPVSDAPVFLTRHFVNGEAISEALACFSRAALEAESENLRAKLNQAMEHLRRMSQYLKLVDNLSDESQVHLAH